MAARYQGWQASVLKHLQSSYNTETGSFSAGALGDAAVEAVEKDGSGEGVPNGKLKAFCIPFARIKAEEAQSSGPEVGFRTSIILRVCTLASQHLLLDTSLGAILPEAWFSRRLTP